MHLFKIGEEIDNRYTVSGHLGYGGMAQVFRAFDKRLERQVALKVLRPHLTEADGERFRREIMALAGLSHPGIATIYDLGTSQHVYFALELIEGGLFTDLGPITGNHESDMLLLQASIEVAETLAYVHQHGMVHRDLTPRNILLTTQAKPKVMDFGLVQLAETSKQITRTGLTLGTPQYMAPEQASGGQTGAHTDLYAFGAVLYRAVTGVPAFNAENDQAVLYQHVYGDVVSPLELNPHLPKSLSTLILSLLSKDPTQRLGSGFRVAEALRSIRYEMEQATTEQRMGGSSQLGVLAHGPAQASKLSLRWQRKLRDGPQWPAAITAAQGFILLGLRSEEVSVLHPANGQIQSIFKSNDEVNSAITHHRGNLYFTSRSGALTALRWPSGEMLWQHSKARAVGLVPYRDDILLSTSYGTFNRLNHAGKIIWSYDAEEPLILAPSVRGIHSFVVTRSGWLHCVDSETGKGVYKIEVGPIVAQPSILNNTLLLPERSGDLHAFDTEKLEVIWTYDTEGEIWTTPVIWRRYVFIISWSGHLRCLSLKTGDDIWSYTIDSKVTATPVLAGGTLYIGTEEGEIIAFDARQGTMLFRDNVGLSPIQASPLVLGNTLVVAALDGTVHAYR